MAYKNKHIVNFGLSDKDFQLLMFLYKNSHCSSIADFFRYCLHEYFLYKTKNKPELDLNKINDDIVSIKDVLYECMGVIKNG